MLDAHALDGMVLAEPRYEKPRTDWDLSLISAGVLVELLVSAGEEEG